VGIILGYVQMKESIWKEEMADAQWVALKP
jgi:hypothetical protein